MTYIAKDYSRLVGMTGFSEALLVNHFSLYQGYVANTNKVMDLLSGMLKNEQTAVPQYAELKRRVGWEFNGMRLHELYFENLGGKAAMSKTGRLASKLTEDFGSPDNWEKDFRTTGAMRGIGWVILYQDNVTGKMFNQWINEHDTGHPSGCIPVLVMDVFEHAFMLDYGLKRAAYIDAFFRNLDWETAENRIK